MKVLVIGSGGREHALCWALRRSPSVDKLLCAPGNPGTGLVAETLPVAVDDIQGLIKTAREHQVDLTVVGPEQPLSLGLADSFLEAGLRVFGPCQNAARIESSKSFAKEIMVAAKVPTAGYRTFEERAELESYLSACRLPIVLKADGLAAGKGVIICATRAEGAVAVGQLYAKGRQAKVLAEDFLEGEEVSYIVATNGKEVVPMASSHDYKRIYDGQRGPNTGGMGSVSPSPRLSSVQEEEVIEHVVRPVLCELERRGSPFCGFLYAGLMLDRQGGIKVLEFNARCGDPESQAIMRRVDFDLAQLLLGLAADVRGPSRPVLPKTAWLRESAVCVVLAAEGYPGEVKTGDEISGI
jgi:phosphoribosylamine---glycine ligase